MAVVARRFDVYLVPLDPTVGSEMQKTRPCVVVSPDVMNQRLTTVIIAPLSSVIKPYPTRVVGRFQGVKGQIVLDQIRTVDRKRLIKRLGRIGRKSQSRVLQILADIFAP